MRLPLRAPGLRLDATQVTSGFIIVYLVRKHPGYATGQEDKMRSDSRIP